MGARKTGLWKSGRERERDKKGERSRERKRGEWAKWRYGNYFLPSWLEDEGEIVYLVIYGLIAFLLQF